MFKLRSYKYKYSFLRLVCRIVSAILTVRGGKYVILNIVSFERIELEMLKVKNMLAIMLNYYSDTVTQNQQASQPDRSGSLRIPFSTWKQP